MAFTRVPLKRAAAAGALAFLASYVVVFVAYLGRFRALLDRIDFTPYGTSSTTLLTNFGGAPPPYWKGAGWLTYNAHFVTVNLPRYPGADGIREINMLLRVGGIHLLTLLVPAIALVLAGYLAAKDVRSTVGGHIYTGLSVFSGYLPLTVLGFIVFSFEYQFNEGAVPVQLTPNPLSGILVMGVGLPVLLGGIGGFLAEIHQTIRGTDGESEGDTDGESSAWG